ncbi:MAG: hypothetical protein RL215_2439 [Planctomycetota bacterium]
MQVKTALSRFSLCLCALYALLNSPQTAVAQKPTATSSAPTTRAAADRTLAIEVLIQPQPRDRIRAQDWGRVLQELGYSPRFRSPIAGEKMRIEEAEVDGRPRVLVVGGLTSDGSLELGTSRFNLADSAKIDAFLKSLKQNGPGGAASGNPRWGLTEQQFLDVSRQLSTLVEQPITLASPATSIQRLGLPPELPVIFADNSLQASTQPPLDSAPEEIDLSGMSQGTALAILLAQYGMGFRPALTKQGSFVLEIHPGGEAENLWPVGWKTLEPIPDVLPAWLKAIPFDIQDADLNSLIRAVADKLQIPAFTSSHKLAAAKTSLDELTWSRTGKLSPFAMLRTVGEKFELGFDVRADETGKLFLWTTTRTEADAFARRFAHIRPTK